MLILNEQNFNQEVLTSKGLFLVDFYADWCQPCQMAAPILEELAGEYEEKVKFGKLNVEMNPQLAAKYQAMSIPTLIIYKNGREVARQIGLESKESYRQFIEKWMT